MNISHFDDLLRAAREQPTPQRLLLVFAGAGLPDDATPQQRADFDAGLGGELAPLMCVDKSPDDVADFAALAREAAGQGLAWRLVFAGALDGGGAAAPAARLDAALQAMVEDVRVGRIERYVPFDREGVAVRLD